MTIYLVLSIAFAAFAAIMFISFLCHKDEVLGNTPVPPVGGAALPKKGSLKNLFSDPKVLVTFKNGTRARTGYWLKRHGNREVVRIGTRTVRVPLARLRLAA